jgi:glycosyltransferase involved in cell wall biosynthesis
VRADLDERARVVGAGQETVLPAFPAVRRSRVRRALDLLTLWRRPEFAFLRWHREVGAPDVLVEELPRLTHGVLIRRLRRRGVRVVVHLHNVRRHDDSGRWWDRLEARHLGRSLRAADLVLVHGHASRSLAARLYGLGSLGVVPHGIRPRRLDALPVPVDSEILLFGVNRGNKGLATLVDALELLPHPPRLVVAGETPERERPTTAELLARLGEVRWIDRFIGEDELRPLTATATAFVLPYLGFEAQSGVLHLAIETAIPVVVSNAGDMAEVVTAFDLGLVVPSGDAQALARAIEEVADPARNAHWRASMLAAQARLGWPVAARALADELRRMTA